MTLVVSIYRSIASATTRVFTLSRYIGNVYVYLPYTVITQTTAVTLATSNIESYTKLKPVTQQGKQF